MIRTVDLVVVGAGSAAIAAAAEALGRGCLVLVVLGAGDAAAERRFRWCLRTVANADDTRATIVAGADVVCVAGVNGVEAVVLRFRRTGYLRAVNASAFVSCGPPKPDPTLGARRL